MTVLNFPATPALNDTYTENGVTYTWNGNYWQANSGSALDDFYVKIAGDSMTGNLLLPGGGGNTAALQRQEIDALITAGDVAGDHWDRSAGALKPKVSTDNVNIGNGNIRLNAGDGSASFAGAVQVGDDPRNGTNAGSRLGTTTGLTATGDTATQYVVSLYNKGVAGRTVGIQADGSAEFAGDISIGGTFPSSPNISLNADGSATFVDRVNVGVSGDDTKRASALVGSFDSNGRYGSVAYHPLNYVASPNVDKWATPGSFTISGQTISGEIGTLRLVQSKAGRIAFHTDSSIITNPDESVSIEANGNFLIGGVLPSAPNISLNADGSGEFAGQVTAERVLVKGQTLNNASTALVANAGTISDNTDLDQYRVLGLKTVADGTINTPTAEFRVGRSVSGSDNANTALGIYLREGSELFGSYPKILNLNSDLSSEFSGDVLIGGTPGIDPKITLNAGDGSAEFAGTVTADNVTFNLEADDDTKYTSTTDAEGNETRVYNGAVLDVKERLTKADAALVALKSAAAAATDFASLQSAIATALADI